MSTLTVVTVRCLGAGRSDRLGGGIRTVKSKLKVAVPGMKAVKGNQPSQGGNPLTVSFCTCLPSWTIAPSGRRRFRALSCVAARDSRTRLTKSFSLALSTVFLAERFWVAALISAHYWVTLRRSRASRTIAYLVSISS